MTVGHPRCQDDGSSEEGKGGGGEGGGGGSPHCSQLVLASVNVATVSPNPLLHGGASA